MNWLVSVGTLASARGCRRNSSGQVPEKCSLVSVAFYFTICFYIASGAQRRSASKLISCRTMGRGLTPPPPNTRTKSFLFSTSSSPSIYACPRLRMRGALHILPLYAFILRGSSYFLTHCTEVIFEKLSNGLKHFCVMLLLVYNCLSPNPDLLSSLITFAYDLELQNLGSWRSVVKWIKHQWRMKRVEFSKINVYTKDNIERWYVLLN